MPYGAVHLVDKALKDLSTAELNQIKGLTFGSMGSMTYRIQDCLEDNLDDRAIFLMDDSKTIIAWSLLFKRDYYVEPKTTAYFFTKADERRQGFGKRIAAHIARTYPNVYVCPHDERSGRFFANMEFDAAPGYSNVMDKYKPKKDEI